MTERTTTEGTVHDHDPPDHGASADPLPRRAQMTEIDGEKVPLFAGVFAIFGHGNVAGFGEALYFHPATGCRPTAPITSRRWRMPRVACCQGELPRAA